MVQWGKEENHRRQSNTSRGDVRSVFVVSVIYAEFTGVTQGTAVKHFFAKGETLGKKVQSNLSYCHFCMFSLSALFL